MLHAMYLEQGLTPSRSSADGIAGLLSCPLPLLPAASGLSPAGRPRAHSPATLMPRPRAHGGKATFVTMASSGLGDTGQQGNFSTQKAQVSTPLLSPGGPDQAPATVSCSLCISPLHAISILFTWNTFPSDPCLKPSPLM